LSSLLAPYIAHPPAPGFITIYLYVSNRSPKTIVLALCTALAIVVPADILRFRFPAFARTYERYLGFLMRDSEKVRASCSHHTVPSFKT
jgi:hypothetical protein